MTDAERDRIAELEAQTDRLAARLREVDHRIKNDLQLINSVFVLQLRKTPEGAQREIVRGALDRVAAVSGVHRRLDVTDDPRRFEASGLVRDLAEDAVGNARREDVRLELEVAPVAIPARQAAPLALIVGELVRNSLRHAFPGRPGAIRVGFGAADRRVRLVVSDDGIGLPAGLAAPRGFGATLVALLAQQLRGEIEFAPADPGLVAIVSFPQSD
ncbi:sensor histidine kinase [Phenylobacterium sp.]|uniref:sensor histidine kinase n=1 Tax=Phenylobacterium sp. TaxID=1871053 RepID=UPI002DEEEEEC|nr:sensor histidine kinase [Phenylobacterium sp.]